MPDYRAVIRRDQAQAAVDGLAVANDPASPSARCEARVYARLAPIRLGGQEIHFEFAVPGRLYWADRPAMRVVQTGRLFQAKKPLGPTL
jgi:hypothetical protein